MQNSMEGSSSKIDFNKGRMMPRPEIVGSEDDSAIDLPEQKEDFARGTLMGVDTTLLVKSKIKPLFGPPPAPESRLFPRPPAPISEAKLPGGKRLFAPPPPTFEEQEAEIKAKVAKFAAAMAKRKEETENPILQVGASRIVEDPDEAVLKKFAAAMTKKKEQEQKEKFKAKTEVLRNSPERLVRMARVDERTNRILSNRTGETRAKAATQRMKDRFEERTDKILAEQRKQIELVDRAQEIKVKNKKEELRRSNFLAEQAETKYILAYRKLNSKTKLTDDQIVAQDPGNAWFSKKKKGVKILYDQMVEKRKIANETYDLTDEKTIAKNVLNFNKLNRPGIKTSTFSNVASGEMGATKYRRNFDEQKLEEREALAKSKKEKSNIEVDSFLDSYEDVAPDKIEKKGENVDESWFLDEEDDKQNDTSQVLIQPAVQTIPEKKGIWGAVKGWFSKSK